MTLPFGFAPSLSNANSTPPPVGWCCLVRRLGRFGVSEKSMLGNPDDATDDDAAVAVLPWRSLWRREPLCALLVSSPPSSVLVVIVDGAGPCLRRNGRQSGMGLPRFLYHCAATLRGDEKLGSPASAASSSRNEVKRCWRSVMLPLG